MADESDKSKLRGRRLELPPKDAKQSSKLKQRQQRISNTLSDVKSGKSSKLTSKSTQTRYRRGIHSIPSSSQSRPPPVNDTHSIAPTIAPSRYSTAIRPVKSDTFSKAMHSTGSQVSTAPK